MHNRGLVHAKMPTPDTLRIIFAVLYVSYAYKPYVVHRTHTRQSFNKIKCQEQKLLSLVC